MPLRRLLQAVNYLVGALLAFALAAAWWFLWRPLPQTSGTLRAPVSRPVTIARDGDGVPSIDAASVEELLFAQGFATAQDRLWQMDMLRRLAAGELAEVAGMTALELDMTARKMRLRLIAEAQEAALPAPLRAEYAAYARGVNHFIDTSRGRLPPEFHAMGYQPRPWRVADTLLVTLQMHRTLSNSWERELEKLRLRATGDPARVDFLYPLRTGAEPAPGSNAWAVSGSWTASGKPILASDPHLEWSVPSIWVQVRLRAPGLHVAGVTVPGLPGVLIGHNEEIAWGITSLEYDEQDLYSEEIDLRTGRYLHKGQVLLARRETEYIAVKGARTIEVPGWITVHGPLFASHAGRQYALRWTAAGLAETSFSILDLNRARNWAEFRTALRQFPGPALNFLYADRAGHIGHQVVGRLPRRPNHAGDLPVEGKDGAAEWDGFIPFDDLPSFYDPPSGLLVSANHNPFPANYHHRVAGHFDTPGRALQILARLRSRRGWKPEEMLAIQKDVYSAYHHFLARTALQTSAKGVNQPQAAEVLDLLKNWDGQMDKDLAAPFVVALFDQHLRRAAARAAAGPKAGDWRVEMAPAVIQRLFTERPPGWFKDYNSTLLTAFTDALDEAARLQGRNPARWRWGAVNHLTIQHPVARAIPWVGHYFHLGPVPMSGAGTTVKQTTAKLGPSLRFVADTASWDNSFLTLVTGQSGHLLSFDYKDHWDAYYEGRGLPFPFIPAKTAGPLTLAP